jgi:hypothetical protein
MFSQRSTQDMSTAAALLPCCRRTNTQLVIETTAGQRITLEDSRGSILIEDSTGNSIRLDSAGVTITASAKVVVSSPLVEIKASSVTVNAAMARFSGVIQANTLIANSVVAQSYSPGAGNIW